MLIPRMTKTQRNAIGSPAEGLMVYQTNDTTGFWYYDGTKWKLLGSDVGSGIAPGSNAGNTLYWDGTNWVESSNIYNAGSSVGIGTNNPNSSAKFEISSTTSGMLIPRMNTAERNTINNPAEGLQIFNTDNKCFEYFAHGMWQTGNCAICPVPDAASNIVGSSTVCAGNTAVSYSVPSINSPTTYTTNYIWNYTGTGATINGNTNFITINFLSSATSGNLLVKGNNICGNGSSSPAFYITVLDTPPVPATGTHATTQTEIIWNWNSVQGATGYKYNTANDYSTAFDNGTTTSFTQTGLICNTSYTLYVWAYNNCGESQALVLNESTTSCFTCGVDNLIDSRDAYSYQTVQIGTQCWMKANLNYASANSWCYQNNSSYCNTDGRLYTWDAATGGISSSLNPSGVQGLCPTGWHIPSDDEWKQLEIYLGMDPSTANVTDWRGNDEGIKLKSTTGWNVGNGTDIVGFTGLPVGLRLSGSFAHHGTGNGFWSSTKNGTYAWGRGLSCDYTTIGRILYNELDGISVRCIKN